MKTFPNWRQVGHAMRWARRQHGANLYHHVTPERRERDAANVISNEWTVGDVTVTVDHHRSWDAVTVTAVSPKVHLGLGGATAKQALGVLAELDLLPVAFSDAYRAGVGIGYRQGRRDGKVECLDAVREVTS